MAMWTVIIKNNSGSDQTIEDLGLVIADGDTVTLSDEYTYDEIAGSDDLRDLVSNGDLVVNDGTNDLSATEGVEYLSLENLKKLHDDFYTKTQLQTSGQAQVHWDNITNAPAIGSGHWIDPVKYRVLDITSTAPGSPDVGDVYVNTGDNHYYKWDGSTWQDEGAAASGDRVINLASSTENIYSFDGSSWSDEGQANDDDMVVVDDDGDDKSAQYIYDTSDNKWHKIGDVDYAGHFDGGPHKHDASEIDVEGTYSNIPGTPTDLESTIASIDTQLGNLSGQGNTLDEAYDEGGAGAGRTITADAGAVKIDASSATNAPLEIVPQSSLPTTGLADGQIAVKDGIVYVYDATRSKWISINRMLLTFGRRGRTRRQWLHFGGGSLPSNNSGFRLPRNAVILSLSGQFDSTGTGTFQLRKNDSASNIATLSVSSALGNHDTSLNVDLNEGDYLQCKFQASTACEDPMLVVEIAWRE